MYTIRKIEDFIQIDLKSEVKFLSFTQVLVRFWISFEGTSSPELKINTSHNMPGLPNTLFLAALKTINSLFCTPVIWCWNLI